MRVSSRESEKKKESLRKQVNVWVWVRARKEEVTLIKTKEYTSPTNTEAEREAGQSVVILAGDAEYDSWANINQEYHKLERVPKNQPLVKRMINYLRAHRLLKLKISHHGSMHSTPLDVYEKMFPEKAIISTKQETSTKKKQTKLQ